MATAIPSVMRMKRSSLVETLGFVKRTYALELSNSSAYRGALIGWAIVSAAPLIAAFFVWKLVLEIKGGEFGGWSIDQFMTYQFLASILFALNTPWSLQSAITQEIRLGELNAYLIRPMNYMLYRIARYAGYNSTFITLMIVPTIVLFTIFQEYIFWSSWIDLLAFVFAVSLGFFIQFLMAYCFALLAFWWDEVGTVFFAYVLVSKFAAGETVPLRLLPEWLQEAVHWTPFPTIAHFPVHVYLGEVSTAEYWQGIGVGAAWVVGLGFLATVLWRRGMKKYGAYGG